MEWSRWNASNFETPQPTKAAKYGKLPTVYTQKAKPAKPKLPISPHNWSGAKVSCQGAIDKSHTHMWYFTVLSNITLNLITHIFYPPVREYHPPGSSINMHGLSVNDRTMCVAAIWQVLTLPLVYSWLVKSRIAHHCVIDALPSGRSTMPVCFLGL